MASRWRVLILVCGVSVCLLIGGLEHIRVYSSSQTVTKHGYGFLVVPPPQWWGSNWTYVKKIVVNHSRVSSNLVNFPVLISEESDADLAAHAQADGGDIVFVDDVNTTQFPHEIEKYDNDSGALVAWVKIPSLSSEEDTIVYMYYGNPGCENQGEASGVWDDSFSGVWHMRDETALIVPDSTSEENDGLKLSEGHPVQGSGVIGDAEVFNGVDDVITVSGSDSVNPAVFTLEYWVRNSPPQTGDFFARMTGKTKGFETAIDSDDGYLNDDVSVCFYDGSWHDTGFDALAGAWYYLAWRYDGVNVTLSVNGSEVFRLDDSGVFLSGNLSLGNAEGSLQGLSGGLDEARLSTVVRSDAWIATSYQTMSVPGSFASIGPEVAKG